VVFEKNELKPKHHYTLHTPDLNILLSYVVSFLNYCHPILIVAISASGERCCRVYLYIQFQLSSLFCRLDHHHIYLYLQNLLINLFHSL